MPAADRETRYATTPAREWELVGGLTGGHRVRGRAYATAPEAPTVFHDLRIADGRD
jgi:hypothetical protein